MHVFRKDAGFAKNPPGGRAAAVARLCDAMQAAEASGRHPHLTIERPWSARRPVLEGEVGGTETLRWFFGRELAASPQPGRGHAPAGAQPP